jgi:hypothetical protein
VLRQEAFEKGELRDVRLRRSGDSPGPGRLMSPRGGRSFSPPMDLVGSSLLAAGGENPDRSDDDEVQG